MKRTTVIILMLLAALLFVSCAPQQTSTATPEATPSETASLEAQDDILLTFCAMSDTHIGDTNTTESLKRILSYANTFEDKPEAYLFVGDVTNTTGSTKSKTQVNQFRSIYEQYGTPEQMLYCLGPTHDVPQNADAAQYRQVYRDALGAEYFANDIQPEERGLQGVRHRIINGFHFFSVDWEGSSNNGILEHDALIWFRDEIAVAVSEDETKPVFVITHVPGVLDSLFRRYPQIVCFTGHLHNSVAREDSISQDKGFTNVHCGGVNYYRVDGYNRFFEDPYLELGNIYEFAQGLYVQVDKDYNVTIKRLDGYNGAVIGEPWVIGPGRYDVYTKDRKDTAAPLTFDRYAKLKVEQTSSSSITVSFDHAKMGDAGPARYYSVELLVKDGNSYKTVQQKDLSSGQVFYPNDQNIPAYNYSCSFTDVDLTDYAVVVTAYDCWNKSANSLVYTNGTYTAPN